MPGLGGHRLINNSIPAGKLQQSAMAQALDLAAFIFPLEIVNTPVTLGATSFTITTAVAQSPSFLEIGIVNTENVYETVAAYGNVSILNSDGEPILSGNSRPIWGRVVSVSGSGPYDYVIEVHDDLDRSTNSPALVNLPTSVLDIVLLPYRKPLSEVDQTEFGTITGGTGSVTSGDLAALETRVQDLEDLGIPVENETPTGPIATGNLSFTLAHTPIAGSTQLFAYGLSMAVGIHYNISGNSITYIAGHEPASGETHRISYRY